MISRVYLEFEFLVPSADQFKWTTPTKKHISRVTEAKGTATTTITANWRMGTEMCEWTHKNTFFWYDDDDKQRMRCNRNDFFFAFFFFLFRFSLRSRSSNRKKKVLFLLYFSQHILLLRSVCLYTLFLLRYSFSVMRKYTWISHLWWWKNEMMENQLFRKCHNFFAKLTLKYN